MWYLFVKFIMWLTESYEEMLGETLAPWATWLTIAIIFGAAGWFFGEWVVGPIFGIKR